jgi:magnesium-transporting ATPase (P-type)
LNFFKFLSLCHKVVVEVDQKNGSLKYQSPSPDEEALVKAAAVNEV